MLGAAFLCDGRLIINYPDQHYANGVSKNTGTGRRFKAVARILKRLRYEMLATNGHPSAMGVQSYGLESTCGTCLRRFSPCLPTYEETFRRL